MRNFLIVAALVSAFPMAASAGNRFEGPHAEVIGGYDRTDVAPGLGAENGAVYGVGGGYDIRRGAVVLGVEAEANDSSVKRTIAGSTDSVGRSFYAGIRAGFTIANTLLVYAKGGYANGRFQRTAASGYTGNGFRVGGGIEAAVGDRFFVKGEYRYSDYGREARGQTATVALGLRF